MIPSDLALWMFQQKLTHRGAARTLGISTDRLYRFLDSRSPIPVHIALACSAIALGIKPFKKPRA